MDTDGLLSVNDVMEQMGSETDRRTAEYMRASNGEKADAFRAFIDAASREMVLLMHANTPASPGGERGQA